nr:uncharacterized protein LOC124808507 [Hydra vulgaris]
MITYEELSDVELSEKIRLFILKFRVKYTKQIRNFARLTKQELPWLEGELFQNKKAELDLAIKAGRPEKKWTECSLRTKRRKVSRLAKTHSTKELAEAAVVSTKSSPKKLDLGMFSQVQTSKTKKKDKHQPTMMSAEQALSLKIHCDLSDSQYQIIRNLSLMQNADIYPPLKTILKSKVDCYPEGLHITETSAKCSF